MIPSGRQDLLDAMEPQVDGTPPRFEKSKQLQPVGQACPRPQSMGLGMQFMMAVVTQGVCGGGGQIAPAAQAWADPAHEPDSPTFTHW